MWEYSCVDLFVALFWLGVLCIPWHHALALARLLFMGFLWNVCLFFFGVPPIYGTLYLLPC